MNPLSSMRLWQRAFIYGLAFALMISVIFGAILVFFQFRMHQEGAPVYCFGLSGWQRCAFPEAVYSSVGLALLSTAVFGIPLGTLSALVGKLVEKSP